MPQGGVAFSVHALGLAEEALMPVEFVGMIGPAPGRAEGGRVHVIGGGIDPEFLCRFAQAHEASGFDRALVGYWSTAADGLQVAAAAAACTDRLGFLIAHRPGFVAPTLAARAAATLDHFSGGRIALHIISGGDPKEQRRDGDFLLHDDRYRRTDEYLSVMRQTWSSDEPFDHQGTYYHFERAFSDVKPLQQPAIPIYFGGSSTAALEVTAKHADVYAMWGEPRAAVAAKIAEVRSAAERHGRRPKFSVSFRPILAATEEKAWERARRILSSVKRAGPDVEMGESRRPEATGSKRLLEFAAMADRHDERLWMPIAAATGARGNTSALVGTPEQVAEALLAYYDLGVTTLLIRGFDPLQDAIDFGEELIPTVRAEVARRDREARQSPPGRGDG